MQSNKTHPLNDAARMLRTAARRLDKLAAVTVPSVWDTATLSEAYSNVNAALARMNGHRLAQQPVIEKEVL
jgi:hypothetical protein